MSGSIRGIFRNIKFNEKQFLYFIVFANLLIKLVPASVLELGNDEVYYWTYALFPDWSHFDHPSMVGLTIQFFTLNLSLSSEFYLRLGSLVFSSVNIILLFKLVKKIYSVEAAYVSSLLFTSSLYFNIICGLFILPDTPQIFFVMLALYTGLPLITSETNSKGDSLKLVLFGLFTGLAFLSKYHALFLWFGFGMYILIHDRRWLKRPALYISIVVTFILMLPVIYWNINNNFISFTFHDSRVGLLNGQLAPDSFLRFNLGEMMYQNPVLFIIYILTLVSLYRKGRSALSATDKLLLWLSLPLILIFTLFSLFNDTLPHWTGPAFIGLLILSSKWLSEKLVSNRKNVQYLLTGANALIILILLAGVIQINYGLLYPPREGVDPKKLGRHEISLDMYGWRQAKIKFEQFLKREHIEEKDYNNVKIVSANWYPGANLDFYVAHPLKIDLLVPGTLRHAHKYWWINKTRQIKGGDRIFYITSSQYFTTPDSLGMKFNQMESRDTLQIKRDGKTVKNLFVFEVMK